MDINIRKNKMGKEENAQEDPEGEPRIEEQSSLRGEQVPYGAGWDMPVSGMKHETSISETTPNPSLVRRGQGEVYEDSRPKIKEISVPIEFPKMLDWWKSASRWALILFAGLTPIFFLPFTALPVAANKEILVFTLILAAFFALLGRILIEGRIRYPGHWLAASLLVLVLVWGIASFFSINQIGSLIGPWATPDSFTAVLLFALLTLSIVMTFDRRDIVVSTLVFLASLSVLGLFELLQLMKVFVLPFEFSKNIAFNPIGSVNDLSVLLAFGLIIGSGLMATPEMSKLLKKLLGISVVILLLNLIIIDFWAIWIGLGLAMVFMITFLSAGLSTSTQSPPYQWGEKEGVTGLQLVYFQKAWLPSIILLISLILLFIPSPLARFIQTPVEVSPNFRATFDIGIANLKSGHYLLGSGPNTFGYIYNLYKPSGINQTIFWSTVFTSGASAAASWVGAVGLLGVLAILLLITAFIWTAVTGTSMRNADKGIMNVASQSIFVAVIFMFTMWFLYVANFTVLAFTFWGIGLFLAASLFFILESEFPLVGSSVPNIFREIRIFTSAPKTFIFSLLIVVLMVGVAAGVYFEVTKYVAEVYFGKAIASSAKGDNEATLGNLNRAVEFWKYDERYFQSLAQATFFKLNALLADRNTPQDSLMTQFQNITSNSIAFAQKAGSLNPQNPFNAALLGGIYENLIPFIGGASDFAISSYEKAIALDPKNPSNYLMIGRVYIARNELDKATGNLESAIELKQDYAPARFLLVQVYDRQGKLPDAIKRAEELVILNNADVGALFQLGFLYYKAERFNDSKLVFERTVELSLNYSNARYFLGLIYDRDGDKAKAMEQFKKISELNPDNAEVKQIIANLAAKKAALFGIAPPAPAPQNRAEAPVSEGTGAPVQKLRK